MPVLVVCECLAFDRDGKLTAVAPQHLIPRLTGNGPGFSSHVLSDIGP